jgi:FkbM family methyltransferase
MHRDLIFDIGMNDGADTAYYLHRGYRVVAVEANPQLAEEARARFRREIADGRLTVLGVAIAGTAGVLPFWICDSHSPWSSFDHEIASRDGSTCHQIDVECRPFIDILEEHGVPYFLKIDIEGTDHLCIRDLRTDDLPVYLSFERIGRPEELLRLSELGYSGFKCISQFAFLPVEWPPAAEERAYGALASVLKSDRVVGDIARGTAGVAARIAGPARFWRWTMPTRTNGDWVFPAGSSGPFGEDTPGRWQSLHEFENAIRQIDEQRQAGRSSPFWNGAGYSFWADIHAKLGS